jgi:hypothetical protein
MWFYAGTFTRWSAGHWAFNEAMWLRSLLPPPFILCSLTFLLPG